MGRRKYTSLSPEDLRPCTGTCGRMTRPTDSKLELAPGTVERRRADGMCRVCIRRAEGEVVEPRPERFKPCAGCGRMTRPASVFKAEAPNTVVRQHGGKCKTCNRAAEGHVPGPLRAVEPTPISTDERINQFRRDLEAWLQKWRVRHDRATRREAITSRDIQTGSGRQVVLQRPGGERRDSRPVGGIREVGERTARRQSAA